MKIKELAISKLKPHPDNPRDIDDAIGPIARSIRNFGFLVPILVNEDNTILAGHVRYQAAKTLDLKSVPTIQVKNLTEAQQKAFMIADNRLAENSTFVMDKLANLVSDIVENGVDPLDTGFDMEEIEAFVESNTTALKDIMNAGSGDAPVVDMTDKNKDGKEDKKSFRLMFSVSKEQKKTIMDLIKEIQQENECSIAEALNIICEYYLDGERNALD